MAFPLDLALDLYEATVLVAPSPATSGLSLTLNSGDGTRLAGVPPIYGTVYPTNSVPSFANAEIFRIASIAGDAITIASGGRAQGGTTARSITVGDNIRVALTAEHLLNIQNSVQLNAWILGAGESFTIPANKQMSFPAGLVSTEPSAVVGTVLGIGIS